MNRTIKINTEEDLKEAIEIIKEENLIPDCDPYKVDKDPQYSLDTVARWNFKRINADSRDVALHLVYSPDLNESRKIEKEINEVLREMR